MCRRDALLEMFWPEADSERARNTLRQAVHFIKQVCGADIFATRGGDEVGLVSGAISVDILALDQRAAEGRHDEVVALYRGEFMEGFVLRGAPAFDRWLQGERTRIRKRVGESAWLAADALLTSGDVDAGRQMGERALALSLDDESAVRRFISTLAASGDRAGALAVYQTFAARMAKAYGVGPSPETRAIVEGLAPSEHAPASSAAPAASSNRRRWIPAAAIAGAALATAAFLWLRPLMTTPRVDTDPNRVVVLPFVLRGPESLRYLEDGLPILLDTRLDGAGALRTVDSRALIVHLGQDGTGAPLDPPRARAVAERFGAQLYVLGTIVGTPDQLRFSVSLYDRAHGSEPIAHTEVAGAETELVHLVDQLATELLAARFHEVGGTIAETAARTTASLPALKAWLVGEAAITAGRYDAAMVALQDAIEADSNFAMAHFRLAVAADWSGHSSIVTAEADRAVALAERMNPSTRLVLLAFQDMRYGNYVSAARSLRKMLAEHPSATEAWYEMGEVLFHGNPPQGRPLVDARDAFERTLRLDPRNFSAVIHLSRIAAALHDSATLGRLTRSGIDSNPDVAQRGELLLLRALSLGDDGARRLFLAQGVSPAQVDALWRSIEYSGNLAAAAPIVDSLARVARPGDLRSGLLLLGSHIAMGQDRFTDANRYLDSLAVQAPQSAAVTRLLLAAHPALPSADRSSLLQRAIAGASPLPAGSQARRVYTAQSFSDSVPTHSAGALRLAYAALHDSVKMRALRNPHDSSSTGRIIDLTEQLMLATDHATRAAALQRVAQIDSALGEKFAGQSAFAPRARFQLAVARALEEEGRFENAYARLQAIPEDFGFNVAYMTEVERRRAALRVKLGRRPASERVKSSSP